MEKKPKVIDLFAGCGGLSYGFIEAGFDVILGVDIDEAALTTYKYNHTNSSVLNADLSDKKTINTIRQMVGNEQVDLIIGGPPCQGFSLTGSRNEDDDRNKLYKAMVDAVRELQPKAFILENVPGLTTLYTGKVKERILEDFKESGYEVSYQILNAADYGVPQFRKRVFFVGLQNGLGKFKFPEPTNDESNYVGCEDAIGDLPSLENELGKNEDIYTSFPLSDYQIKMREESEILHNHLGTRHTEEVIDVIKQVPEGGNHKDLPPGVGESRKFNEAWTRYHSKRPSKTIDTGHRNHFHYKYNRVPTARENARLQSFPDKFVFLGNKTQQYRQVGNAVPPLLGYHLGKQLLKHVSKEEGVVVE
ncbi:TPA: DNA cytosine methyltransferase [Bacillus mobilis]|uniref:DNA cytosine methyltransferase n=1 Tax=Bacillus mobilis TaxID=2026190 RepID=UPI0021BD05A7|nr:DNA cytosine methyltransferase [Bacillus mobilis]MED4384479.1 DNA cytosine methyltransferase [Bacillus mobilis]